MVRLDCIRWIALAGATLAVAAHVACGGAESCVQSKCTSGAWLHIPLTSDVASLAGAAVSVCRNDECYTAPLPDVPSADSAGSSVSFAGTVAVLGTLWQKADRSVVLDVEWHVGDPSQTVDGDHYVVKLTNAAGVATTLLDKPATYHLTELNPEECTPATRCTIVELTP
jgi:hypothetical protein